MKRPCVLVFAGAALLALVTAASPVAEAGKVDCAKVMASLDGGKKPKEVAREMEISVSSVYRCRKKAAEQAQAGSAPKADAEPPAASAR
jgi:hypothetical protein